MSRLIGVRLLSFVGRMDAEVDSRGGSLKSYRRGRARVVLLPLSLWVAASQQGAHNRSDTSVAHS